MNYYAVSSILVVIFSIFLGIFVYLKNKTNPINISYSLGCLSLAIWNIMDFVLSSNLKIDMSILLVFSRYSYLGISLFPLFLIYFGSSIIGESPNKYIKIVIYILPVLISILSISTPYFIKEIIYETSGGFTRRITRVGPLYDLFILYLAYAIIYYLYKISYNYKKTKGQRKTQLKYLIFGSCMGLAAGQIYFIQMLGINIPPSENFFVLIYIGIFAYAIVRHHLMDIHSVISKAVTFGSMSILTALASIPVLLSWEHYLFGEITQELVKLNWFIVMSGFFLSLITTLLYPRIIAWMQKKFKDIFFKEKYDYKEVVEELNNAIVNVLDLESLLKVIVEQLNRAFDVSKISIIAFDQRKNNYKIFYSSGLEQELIDSFKIMPSDHFIDALKDTKKIIIKEERERMLEEPPYQDAISKYKEVTSSQSPVPGNAGAIHESPKTGSEQQAANGESQDNNQRNILGLSEKEWKRLNYWFIVEKMKIISAEISIPLFLHDKLIGIISMDMKGNKDAYSDEDLTLLNTLSTQAAVAIQNAQLVEMDNQRFQMVRHMDKLASLGLLVSGVAHEIRNPLGTIKTFFQLFPERCDNEEFKTIFYKLAMGEADRISRLVDEILGFSRVKGAKLVLENLNDFIEKIIIFVEMETKRKNVKFEKKFDGSIPRIMFDMEKMKQVFLNFFMNAIEAMKKGGTLSVSTQKIDIKGKDYIRIDISDTGEGISEENLGNLFTPFFTTKDEGTGLGLSISHQIIADHNGMIEIKSQINKGTTFYIYLPVEQLLSAQEEKPVPKLAGLKRVLDNPGIDYSKI